MEPWTAFLAAAILCGAPRRRDPPLRLGGHHGNGGGGGGNHGHGAVYDDRFLYFPQEGGAKSRGGEEGRGAPRADCNQQPRSAQTRRWMVGATDLPERRCVSKLQPGRQAIRANPSSPPRLPPYPRTTPVWSDLGTKTLETVRQQSSLAPGQRGIRCQTFFNVAVARPYLTGTILGQGVGGALMFSMPYLLDH